MLSNSRSLPSFSGVDGRPKTSSHVTFGNAGLMRPSSKGSSLRPLDRQHGRPMTVKSDPGPWSMSSANHSVMQFGQRKRPSTVGTPEQNDWSAMWAFPTRAEPKRGVKSTTSDEDIGEISGRPNTAEVNLEEQRWLEAKLIIQKSAGWLPALRDPGSRHEARRLDPIVDSNQQRRGPNGSKMTPNSKRTNALNALAHDRSLIQQRFVDQAETLVKRTEREAPVTDHHWALLFAPVKNPRDHVPKVFSCGLDPLVVVVPEVWQHSREPILSNHEAFALLNVCKVFAKLVRPHVHEGEDPGAEVITRPALCRLLLALRLCGPGSRFFFQSVIRQFDALADVCTPQGCPLTAGITKCLALAPPRGREKNLNELPICKTFGSALESLAELSRGSRPLDQQLPIIKELFFSGQLVGAEVKAKKRIQKIDGLVMSGRKMFPMPETKVETSENKTEDNQSQDKKSKDSGKANKRRSQTKQMETEEVKEDVVEELPPGPDDILYAHTFAVSKGELLASMLLEPEILQFTWMFSGIVQTMFRAYSDVPTDFLKSKQTGIGGHMSYGGFMRFCIDFGLFPTVVDFNSLQCIYRSADCAQDLTREDILDVMERDKNTLKFKVDDVVELDDHAVAQQKGPGLRFGEPGLIIAVDYDKETQACRVMTRQGKKRWYQFEDLKHCGGTFRLIEAKAEKDVATRCEWVNRDIGEMSDIEIKAMSLLSAMEDWMSDHRLRVRDVFGMIDQSGDRGLSGKEILKGVEFMSLENCPSLQDMEQILELIDDDGSGEIEINELDTVLMAVRERKARQKKFGNFFMKPPSEMTAVENAAAEFFMPLEAALTNRSWGANEFFDHFDQDGSGSMDLDEMITAAKHLGIHVADESLFKRACVLVDPNMDGTMEVGELNRVLAMVREVLRSQEKELQDAKNPFLSLGATTHGPQIVRIFGYKAFTECILKIGLSHLSFHGTGAQSELPSYTKALWLIAFLSWQFNRRKMEYKIAKAVEVEKELKRGVGLEDIPQTEESKNMQKWAKRQPRRSQRGLSTVLQGMEAKGLRKKMSLLANVKEESKDDEDDGTGSKEMSTDLAAGTKSLRTRRKKKDKESEAAAKKQEDMEAYEAARDKPLTGVGKLARMKLQKVVAEKRYATYLPPLKRLIVQHANLFSKALTSPPRDSGSSSLTDGGSCHKCGSLPQQGWGNAFCPECGQADHILRAALISEDPVQLPILDAILCMAAAPIEVADDDDGDQGLGA